jgi:hypothetical protein
VCVVLLNCTSDDAGKQTATRVQTRDSAGITIVTNPAGVALDHYAPSPAGKLVIGAVDGATEYNFNRIRSVTQLQDSSIAVLDGNEEVRVFDAAGRYLRKFGGAGNGPGELTMARRVWSNRDTVIVWQTNNRLTFYPMDDGRPRTRTLGGPYALTTDPQAWLLNDHLVVPVSNRPPIVEGMQGRHPGDVAVQVRFVATSLGTGEQHTLATVAGATERFIDLAVGPMRMANFYPLMLHGTAHAAAANSVFFSGDGTRPVVHVVDTSGARIREIRWDTTTLAVNDSITSAYRATLPPAMRAVPMADSLPYFTDIKADRKGGVWVRLFVMPGSGSQRWLFFDRDGVRTGVAELTERLTIHEFAAPAVLGVAKDSLGVETVVRLQLDRPSRQ